MRPFAFVHASDLHLDCPVTGLADPPEALRNLLVDAPLRAATRLFDWAISQQVQFVLLSGDVLHPTAGGGRAWAFLIGQLERVTAAGIAIYWAGGRADGRDDWPVTLKLPPGVRRFAGPNVERAVHLRDGEPMVEILGRGYSGQRTIPACQFEPNSPAELAIALAYGSLEGDSLGRPVGYWALGGEHARRMLRAPSGGMVHYPGTPQGRTPCETGQHGCSLVEVDEHGAMQVRSLATDQVRWFSEKVLLDEDVRPDAIRQLVRQRAAAIVAAQPGAQLLVEWSIRGSIALQSEFRRGLSDELLSMLQREFGGATPGLWSASLELLPVEVPPHLTEQQTLLGELLRTVRHLEDHPEMPLDLDSLLSERQRAGDLATALQIDQADQRARVLRQTAWLGVDLLSRQEPAR